MYLCRDCDHTWDSDTTPLRCGNCLSTEFRTLKQFEISYIFKRPNRIVDETHFEKSSAFYPVLSLKVGESAPKRYRSAGYRNIKRIA